MSLPSIRVGFQTLRSNLLRTALSTLGVVMGVASLVAVLALGDGMERFFREQIERTTSLQAVAVRPDAGREVDGIFVADSMIPELTVADAGIVAKVPRVKELALTVEGTGTARLASAPATTADRGVYVQGVMASQGQLARMRPVAGRVFDPAELVSAAPVAVLGDSAARLLAGGRDASALVGDTIRLQSRSFTVLAVLGRGSGASLPTVYVPYPGAQAAMAPARAPRIPVLVAIVDSAEAVIRTRGMIEAALLAAHPDWKGRITVRTNESRAQQAAQGILLFKLFMGAITGISLLVGGIGIMNVLLAAVAERTREIGIRRATGARKRDILVQFLSESVAITALGSFIGLVLGLGGALAATAAMRHMTRAQMYAGFSWSTVFVAAGAAVAVGLAFGTYPALRASRLSPIDAIRRE